MYKYSFLIILTFICIIILGGFCCYCLFGLEKTELLYYLYVCFRNVAILDTTNVPPVCRQFLQLTTSTPFCLLLAHMTELELIENMIKPMLTANKDSSKDNNSSSEADLTSNHNYASNTDTMSTNYVESCDSNDHSEVAVKLTSSALCRSDVNSWDSGNYVLAKDLTDPGLGKFCLEAVLNFNLEG